MTRTAIFICIFLVAALAGCSSKQTATSGQSATLALKDGSSVTGTVTKSDTSSITIQTDSGVVSTYPLTQVASVSYNSTPAAPQTPAPAEAANQAPPAGQPPAADPAPPVPAETFLTIPSGATLAIRTDQTIDSETASVGETYSGTVARDVVDTEGKVAIPRRSRATLVIRAAEAQGKVQGQSELVVDVASVKVGDRNYRLETSNFVEKGKQGVGTNRRTAEFTGGGTAVGTIIGALAGGGKGAAIGALSGAAAGAGTQAVTRGKGAKIPAETVLNFRLEAPIRIREMK